MNLCFAKELAVRFQRENGKQYLSSHPDSDRLRHIAQTVLALDLEQEFLQSQKHPLGFCFLISTQNFYCKPPASSRSCHRCSNHRMLWNRYNKATSSNIVLQSRRQRASPSDSDYEVR